jgi:uncharacterized protein YjbJ (UPF0337 family)
MDEPSSTSSDEQLSDDLSRSLKAEGDWNQLLGKAKQLWGELTDDDLAVVEGNLNELLGRIQAKTGSSMEEIRKRLLS